MCAPVVDTRDFFAVGNFKAERHLYCCRKSFQHKLFPLTGNWALAWNVMCAPVIMDTRDFLQQEISKQKCTCTVAGTQGVSFNRKCCIINLSKKFPLASGNAPRYGANFRRISFRSSISVNYVISPSEIIFNRSYTYSPCTDSALCTCTCAPNTVT